MSPLACHPQASLDPRFGRKQVLFDAHDVPLLLGNSELYDPQQAVSDIREDLVAPAPVIVAFVFRPFDCACQHVDFFN